MSEITFDEAVNIALNNAQKMLPKAKGFALEEALLSDDGKNYELTFSYIVEDHSIPDPTQRMEITHLLRQLREKKEYRTFIVGRENGMFKGFRMIRDRV
ncbi:hypothetical protein D3C78_1330570 [compost metagenome]